MPLQATQFIDFGGVDSRSNPVALGLGKFCRLRNLIAMPDRHLRLRDGFTQQLMGTVTNAPIHSATGFDFLNGSTIDRYLVYGQGTVLRSLKLSDGTVTTPTVKGAAISTSNPWVFSVGDDGKLYAVNGSQCKFYDGSVWRDTGLRAPTSGEVSGTVVTIGAADANGVPASSVGGTQPGYQWYIAIYNLTTGMIGNCVKIGTRLVPGVASDFGITGLPNYSGVDTEWVKLIGRTQDGGEIPYAVMDASGNWVTVANATTSATITQGLIDTDAPLPQRNDVPPAFDKICRAGERFYGCTPNSPSLWKSAAQADAQDGKFVGKWEQCFSADDIETMPTGEKILALREYGGGAWCFSQRSSAILVEIPGDFQWQGPWAVGIAGQEAFCSTPYGPFWVTDKKQGATMTDGGPIPISDEYEAALLGRIGDAYLSKTRCMYECNPTQRLDRVVVKCIDASGNPFHVYHDFKLRDASSSPYEGSGYDAVYGGVLTTDYITLAAHDALGTERPWAGASNGRFYQLSNGGDDNGTNFTGDAITLINAGPDRPTCEYFEWYGDGAVQWSVAQTLDSTLGTFTDITSTVEQVQGGEHDFQYRVAMGSNGQDTTLKHIYVRVQLTSHPGDGNMSLNDPPHVPLESYGRIYMVDPLMGAERGHTV